MKVESGIEQERGGEEVEEEGGGKKWGAGFEKRLAFRNKMK